MRFYVLYIRRVPSSIPRQGRQIVRRVSRSNVSQEPRAARATVTCQAFVPAAQAHTDPASSGLSHHNEASNLLALRSEAAQEVNPRCCELP